MSYNIETLKPPLYTEYEKFVIKQQNSLLYYSIKYKRLLENLLNCKSNYFIAKKDDQIKAILPIMELDGIYGKILNSLPYYGSNGSVLSEDKYAGNLLFKALQEYVQDKKIAACTIISPTVNAIIPQEFKYHFKDERISQITPLNFDSQNLEESYMDMVASSTRRNIRKAQKSYITIEVDNKAIEFLYKTHIKNMQVIGGKAKEKKFFELVNKCFAENTDYKIYTAKKNGELIAALLLFYYNKTVEYFTPVTVEEYRNVQPMALILKHAMIAAFKDGYRAWNWGGTWISQEGVYKFKEKFGGISSRYNYYTYLNNKTILNCTTDELLKFYPNFYVLPFNVLNKEYA